MRSLRSLRLLAASTIAALGACGGGSDKSVAPPPPLTLSSISPAQGTAGTQVKISGTNFGSGATVSFGTHAASSVQLQNGALYAVAPDSLALGTTYDVKVVSGASAATLPAAFQAVAPALWRVNGATKPTGLVGMTVLIEGTALGDARHGKVWFTNSGSTTPIQAAIVDSTNDWTNDFVVTTVPQGVTSGAKITVQTSTGTSAGIAFTLVSGATFSPSTISWTPTTALPRALQGLGAVFVPSPASAYPNNYVFVVGGAADSTNVATTSVFRAVVQSNGALGAWTNGAGVAPLPAARAYAATAAATAYNSPLDTTTTAAYLYALGGVDSAGTTVSTVYVAKVAAAGDVGAWQTTTALPAALHAASAVVFRGYLYLAGGASGTNVPSSAVYRAAVNADGTLGAWQSLGALPGAVAFGSLLDFGPYLYMVGGDSGAVTPVSAASSGTEVANVSMAKINLRDGSLPATWSALAGLSKGRSKHNTLPEGGYLFATSGVYSGSAGSSENTYSAINSDGTIGSWTGATGSNTIGTLLGYDLYNEAALSFVDAAGKSHVIVLGGAKRQAQGRASAAVVYY